MNLMEVNKNMYNVINKIGRGGFSEVFSAVSIKSTKLVAIKKVNLKDLDQESIDLVMNEIELLKKLQDSKKVVQLYE